MDEESRSSVETLNKIVLDVFKLNGFFIKAANQLTDGSELTSARWQVLGAVLHEQLTVAAIARSMGLSRQSVQRVANELARDGLAEFLPNPAHKRAMLFSSTEIGLDSIRKIRPKVISWAERVNELIGDDELVHAEKVIASLLLKLSKAEAQLLEDDE